MSGLWLVIASVVVALAVGASIGALLTAVVISAGRAQASAEACPRCTALDVAPGQPGRSTQTPQAAPSGQDHAVPSPAPEPVPVSPSPAAAPRDLPDVDVTPR